MVIRFEKDAFECLAEALDLPEVLRFSNGYSSCRLVRVISVHISTDSVQGKNRVYTPMIF